MLNKAQNEYARIVIIMSVTSTDKIDKLSTRCRNVSRHDDQCRETEVMTVSDDPTPVNGCIGNRTLTEVNLFNFVFRRSILTPRLK